VSNHLALATVTATIGRMVGEALERVASPSGIPRVRFGPPTDDPQHLGCTVFLYRVAMSPHLRNTDLATRDESGTYVERPHAALDADYLLTFGGDEATLEPQRFLGAAVSALHARPFLSAEAIRRVIAATPYLAGSDLDGRVERVRLVPQVLDHQAMTQLWGTFPRVPYNLWIAYRASTILIEADVTPVTPPPVRTVEPTVLPR
jgi:hypothetical protein